MTLRTAPVEGAERVQYSKIVDGCLTYVIVDLHPGDRTEFWSQEAGEVRWYRFFPAPGEVAAALALFVAAPSRGSQWPMLKWAAPAPADRGYGSIARQLAGGRIL
jgi:hypothetical protein